MTGNDLRQEIKNLRKGKNRMSQKQLAEKIGMYYKTYENKERYGNFEDSELIEISKVIGGKDTLLSINKSIIKITDLNDFLRNSAINTNATQRVVLMALAELLGKQRGVSTSEVLDDLTKIVEAEKALHPMR